MNKPIQLTFPWLRKTKASFDNFYFDSSNKLLRETLEGNEDLFLFGSHETGKTYLLNALCNNYAENDLISLYIPIKEVIDLGPQFLESLENLNLICIDDINLVSENQEWEIAVFNLINSCLLSNCRLVFASSVNLSEINFQLPDLVSRIKKIHCLKVYPIKENRVPDAIKYITKSKSINLGENEINYLMTHSKRGIANLTAIIDQLDKLSMELKRKITIPLIKKLFSN